MAAYLVFIKNCEYDAAGLADYEGKAQASMAGQPITPLVAYGAIETLEGAEAQGAVILSFPTMDEARAWYNSDAYQQARKVRFLAADYRVILTQGL